MTILDLVLAAETYCVQIWHFGHDPWRITGMGITFREPAEAEAYLIARFGPMTFESCGKLIEHASEEALAWRNNLAVVYRVETTTVVSKASLAEDQAINLMYWIEDNHGI